MPTKGNAVDAVVRLVAKSYPDVDLLNFELGETDDALMLVGAASLVGDKLFEFVVLESREVASGYEADEDMALREVHEAMERAIADLEAVRAAVAKRIDALADLCPHGQPVGENGSYSDSCDDCQGEKFSRLSEMGQR